MAPFEFGTGLGPHAEQCGKTNTHVQDWQKEAKSVTGKTKPRELLSSGGGALSFHRESHPLRIIISYSASGGIMEKLQTTQDFSHESVLNH
jgi:hypothetical protein